MKMRLSTALAILLLFILSLPVLAYSAWQPEASNQEDLAELVLELRNMYQVAVDPRCLTRFSSGFGGFGSALRGPVTWA